MGVLRPELVMKSIVPVIMAGVLGIYGLIIAVIVSTGSTFHLHIMTSKRGGELLVLAGCNNQLLSILIPICSGPTDMPRLLAVTTTEYTLYKGYAHLSAGLSCGLGSLAAGMCIGIVGDAGVRCVLPSRLSGKGSRVALGFRLPDFPTVMQGQRSAAPPVRGNVAYSHFR
jgi:F0F1-type ATP synthase membrane subunit c/vacuolar-type H+-ATPase subunit K